MRRKQKKTRAKLRSQRWASEKVLDAFLNGPYPHTTNDGVKYVLRHGKNRKPDEKTRWYPGNMPTP